MPRAEETKEIESSKNREPPGYHKEVSHLNGTEVCFLFSCFRLGCTDWRGRRVILLKATHPAGINGVRGILFPVPLEHFPWFPGAAHTGHCVNIRGLVPRLIKCSIGKRHLSIKSLPAKDRRFIVSTRLPQGERCQLSLLNCVYPRDKDIFPR